ncbi:MAG: phage tail family protein [Lachnospiraceae bacterium]|nr:phage tail family protein [Lachnospiraceae bacterium]MBD5505967.1 phage tail family protein [Lachnospiraceae bacterium]
MKKVKCVNDMGLSVTFTYDHESTEFFLVSLEGVYKMKNTVNTSNNATTDGSSYSGETLEQRNIVITANICRNYRANRELLSRVFKPKSEGIFYHTEDGETRKISYRVEDIDIAEKGVIRPAVISLICPDPYFKDDVPQHIEMSNWEGRFEFPVEIEESGMEFGVRIKETIKVVDNNSTMAIGIKMTIIAEDVVVNPSIMNVTTRETLKLLCTMQPDDQIVITTEQGNIDVVLYRGGEEIDYNYVVDEDNEGYVQLETGRNYINYTAESGSDYMSVNFDFENCYVMP